MITWKWDDITKRNRSTLHFPLPRNHSNITQYRPISLCSVIYKICSKVLANHLREILDEIFAEEQSAFVPGRLITDNFLTAYKCIDAMKRKKGK
uniref:Reverse transcriptase domain-containing protein n=1 Tax=Aegilops tauschii subsp. strangulata TaxID=200361 RepID=A0A453NLF5_AEGTS